MFSISTRTVRFAAVVFSFVALGAATGCGGDEGGSSEGGGNGNGGGSSSGEQGSGEQNQGGGGEQTTSSSGSSGSSKTTQKSCSVQSACGPHITTKTGCACTAGDNKGKACEDTQSGAASCNTLCKVCTESSSSTPTPAE